MLPWQNIFNSKQIAADIGEKLANKEKVLHGGISRNLLFLVKEVGIMPPSYQL